MMYLTGIAVLVFVALALALKYYHSDPNEGVDLTPTKDLPYVKKTIFDPKAVWKFDKDEPVQVFLLNGTEEKRIEKHVGIMVDDIALIVEHNTDVGDIRKYIHSTYSELLEKLFDRHKAKDNKLLDELYEKHQLSIWNDFNVHTMVHMNFSGINIVL